MVIIFQRSSESGSEMYSKPMNSPGDRGLVEFTSDSLIYDSGAPFQRASMQKAYLTLVRGCDFGSRCYSLQYLVGFDYPDMSGGNASRSCSHQAVLIFGVSCDFLMLVLIQIRSLLRCFIHLQSRQMFIGS